MDMYLIAGLGNPEEEYSGTRHNMGFDTINQIAKNNDIKISKRNFDGLFEIGNIQNKKTILLKPQTYMNDSGKSIKQVVDYYNIPMENIIIIYDDIDTKKGTIKVRKIGGPGSHKGMQSVIQNLNSTEFARIRVGIGRPVSTSEMINYVIGNVPEEEKQILKKGVEKAAMAIEEILKSGIDIAMNKFN